MGHNGDNITGTNDSHVYLGPPTPSPSSESPALALDPLAMATQQIFDGEELMLPPTPSPCQLELPHQQEVFEPPPTILEAPSSAYLQEDCPTNLQRMSYWPLLKILQVTAITLQQSLLCTMVIISRV